MTNSVHPITNVILAISPKQDVVKKNHEKKNDWMTTLVSRKTAPLVAGLAGGAVSTFLLYPLDLVKVRLQVNEEVGKSSKRRGTMCNTVRSVLRHEGLLGLYQGLSPALIGSSASWGGYFFFYESMKKEMLQHKTRNSIGAKDTVRLGHLENFSAACLSGAIMVLFTNPIWLVKTRMQLQMKRFQEQQLLQSSKNNANKLKIKPPYKNMVDAFRTIIREEGPLALYRGSIPALMLVTHGGIQFVTYEFLKLLFGEFKRSSSSLQKNHDDSTKNKIIFALRDSFGFLTMGALSKVVASTVTYPIQLMKSRLQQRSQGIQISSTTGELEVVKREYSGVIDCATKILKREGIFGFFKGCLPNAIRVAPSAAITFVVYEGVMDILE